MFYNRVQMKKSALALLQPRWDKAAFIGFFSPLSIGLFFYCALRVFLWFLLMYASMIPLVAGVALMKHVPVVGIIVAFLGVFIFFFVYMLVLAKMVSYSMAFYAFADNPELGVTESAKFSIEVTNGFRTNLFVTQMSFLGWFMLGSCTFGIALFWVIPYYSQTLANSWLFMKQEKTASFA